MKYHATTTTTILRLLLLVEVVVIWNFIVHVDSTPIERSKLRSHTFSQLWFLCCCFLNQTLVTVSRKFLFVILSGLGGAGRDARESNEM